MTALRRGRGGNERGSIVVLFGVLLPLVLVLSVGVIDVGNWWVHGRHLQTKVDAAAFAGGSSWGFPCGGDIEAEIEVNARRYVGQHMQADGAPFTSTTFNPQVGQTPGSLIHVVLNGSGYWDDDEASAPLDRTSPANPSICESKTLDVKATEANNLGLFRLLPFFPDIKRKARVRIEEVDGLTGLLPIGVRLPQPLSAAAVFYDEASPTNEILDVQYFREVCTPFSPGGCIFGVPPGLGQWTTAPAIGDDESVWARFPVSATTGVVVATSVRPRCGAGDPPAGPPCLDADELAWKGQPVNDFCQQASGAVQCFDADGSGVAQTVQSGVHFIHGYSEAPVGAGPPAPRSAYLDPQSAGCSGYFNSSPNGCTVRLGVKVDLGSVLEDILPTPPDEPVETRIAGNVDVRYRLVRADGTSFCNFGANCALQKAVADTATGTVEFSTQGTTVSPHLPVTPGSRGNAVAIEIRLKESSATPNPGGCGPGNDFSDNCRWYYTGTSVSPSVPPTDADVLASPIQRSFMGDLDRTGPLKWLRLTVDTGCDPDPDDWIVGGGGDPWLDAASQPTSERCYFIEMGMAGGLARDQDEPPIALNLGSGSSQRALIDCDPDLPNLKDEIVSGCGRPSYAANKFDTTPVCPGTPGFFAVPPPVAGWPPYRCVLTQTTAAANQIVQGFNERIFNKSNNPQCPVENTSGWPPPAGVDPPWTRGRNYWHRENNIIDDFTFAWDADTPLIESDDWGNEIRSDDPRLVTLFFTTYDSFTAPGNDVYPVVGFGNFYVTGYGRTSNGGWQGGAPDDPCTDGNVGPLDGLPLGQGNEPPPDIDFSKNTTWVWGHFLKDVVPAPFSTGSSGVACNPETSFQPCVAVLVE